MYVFGGANEENNKMNDLWKFDLITNEWSEVKTGGHGKPSDRSGHAAVMYLDKMYIFGGLEGITHEMNDFYYFDLTQNNWHKVQPKVPNPEELR